MTDRIILDNGPADDGPARPKLERRSGNRVVAGVCDAIARHLGVDPLVIRIAFVASAAMSGLGIVAYAVGWWAIPPATDS